ncbi:hypothetical protein SLS58_004847 [Diplodia intermedia]|uniref:Uncharacterized protein n=1 Tax=Diplodia intermedia TaxID=856260 RepID=A0ABR3TSE8_9PEZI
MYRNRNDPRLRRTLDELSHNIESANEAAQEGIYAFSHNYINPCVASVSRCFEACAAPCLGSREDRLLRRRRGRGRARAEHYFDFYDDWEEEENDDPFAWGNSEFDRLLAGQGSSSQPGRQRAMSYGARRGDARHPAGRRKSVAPPHDGSPDPTIIPTSSYFGFLGRLPFRLGGKGLRYKPSAADLQDHPGASRRSLEEHDPLIEEPEEFPPYLAHRRQRSGTNESGVTSDSLSSRGDILPSEDELDDAVPLDDEFAMALERRNTATFLDDTSSGKTPNSRRPRASRTSTRTVSSKGTRDSRRRSTATSPSVDKRSEAGIQEVPTLSELKFEEVRIQKEEEENIERRRDAARALAVRRGLKIEEDMAQTMPSETKSPIGSPKRKAAMSEIRSAPASPPRSPRPGGTIPFPSFDSHPTSLATSPTSHPHAFGGSTPIKPTKEDNQGFVPAKLPSFAARPE